MTRSTSLATQKWDCVCDCHQLLTVRRIRTQEHRRQRQTVLVYRLMALYLRLGSQATGQPPQWHTPSFRALGASKDAFRTGAASIDQVRGF